ncbi:hypothetical protein [Streptomyces beijiangensis]|uniref:Uncharacterized protein n=1 Tax=Streptomyces beijiangensis TaxID=163361 RepID=A0A939FCT6_9ACTN|nr:hypothetical protein [Streptomyces beijiangensis]MBO0515663.1 hypothetical protein [Streptomyces beijiangensis]
MATTDGPDRGIHIGSVHGAFAIGDQNTVTNYEVGAEGRDAGQEELLVALQELRADLGRLVASEQTAALDAELAGAQDEIEGEGAAGPVRLGRLRQALADAGSLTAMFASGAATAQAVAALLGG